MKLRYFFLTIMLFLVSNDFGFAQQSTELTVPEGTIVHVAEEPTVPEGTIVHVAEEPINDIAYSPDGLLLAAASDSGIWLYDTVTHNEVIHIVGHEGSVNSISFSPDSKTLASGDSASHVYLWDVATGKLRSSTEWSTAPHRWSAASVSFSPIRTTLVSAGDLRLLGWNVPTVLTSRSILDRSFSIDFDAFDGINFQSVSFSPAGRMVALGNVDGRVILYDVRSDRIRHTLEGHTDSVLSVAFNSSGLIVASASFDQTVRLWDVTTGVIRHTLEGHTFDVNSVAFSLDGRILASAGDSTVRLWSVITGEHLRTLYGHTGFVNSVSFSPDGKTLASAGSDGIILLWAAGWPAADLNRDDSVNILDLVLVAGAFGQTGENEADVNGDGFVNILDLVAVAAEFGN